jgi:amino acid transporter
MVSLFCLLSERVSSRPLDYPVSHQFCPFRRNYFAQWAVVLPLEITAAGITVQYWEKAAAVPIAVWITVFWVGESTNSLLQLEINQSSLSCFSLAIIAVNVFGTLGYAEEEFCKPA